MQTSSEKRSIHSNATAAETTQNTGIHRRWVFRLLAMTLLSFSIFSAASHANAQTPVPPQAIEPGFSTMGLFLDNNGLPVYGVVNLAKTQWNGIPVITGNFYDFQTGAMEFLVVLPAAPATVVWFAGRSAGWLAAIDGSSEPRWGDNFGNLGTYVPL